MMRRFGSLAALCVLALCASSANAATVSFLGVIDNEFGAGPLTNGQQFTLSVDFTEGTGALVGSSLNVTNPPPAYTYAVTGINLSVTDGAVNDTAFFNVQLDNGAGNMSFTFERDPSTTSGGAETLANVRALVLGQTTGYTLNIGGGSYAGDITGVPEPSSCLALLGLVGGGAWRLRRKHSKVG